MLNAYQEQLVKRLRNVRIGAPPSPWRHIATLFIGGVQAIGFSASEQFLLVISPSGRGLFELDTGFKLARDYEAAGEWWDVACLRALGLPPIENEWVTLSGIHGGGFAHITNDGWLVERIAPDWPNEFVFLSNSGSALSQQSHDQSVNLGPAPDGDELVTFGFSPSGQYLLIATSSAVEIFGRKTSAG